MTRARNIAGFSTITTTPSPVHVGPIGVLTATRIDGEFNQVDLATRNITAAGIAATNLQVSGITTGLNVSGIITAQNGINFNGTSTGLNVSGVGTIATLSVTGNATVGGVLTYEDVTNVDSVGVLTARSTIDAQGDVSIADKIIHTGDTNTAIRFPAADTVTVETGGNERTRVDGSGNFLVGATSASGKLHVEDSGEVLAYIVGNTSSAGSRLVLQNKNTTANSRTGVLGADAGGQTTAQILFYSADNDNNEGFLTLETRPSGGIPIERLRITSTGNVGINETSPSHKLVVGGDIGVGFNTPNNAARQLNFNVNRGSAGDTLANINWQWNSKYVAQIRGIAGSDTTNKDNAHLAFFTSNANNLVERLRIDSSGNVMIGTTTEGIVSGDDLTIANSGNMGLTLRSTDSNYCNIYFSDATSGTGEYAGYVSYQHSTNSLQLATSSTERLRINSDGNVLINTTATPTGYGNLNIFGTDNIGSRLAIRRGSADANGPQIWFNKSRNTTDGSHTVVQSGDLLGSIVFTGNDSQGPEFSARIKCEVDGTPGSNDMPGRLVFDTTPDGSDTLAEALRITSDKLVNIAGQGSVFGRLNVPVATQSGGAAIQVMNTAGGSGDGTLTNIALRSVNSTGSQWAHAEYRAHSHKFLHQGTTKVTINTNGLCFNSDTGSANALHDYEEGTFTPNVSSGLAAGQISFNSRSGRYTKVGNLVHFTLHMNISSTTMDSGSLKFGSLPFTAEANDGNKVGAAFLIISNGNLPEDCTFRVETNTTDILVITAAGDAVAANSTSLNAGNRQLALAGFYYTSS